MSCDQFINFINICSNHIKYCIAIACLTSIKMCIFNLLCQYCINVYGRGVGLLLFFVTYSKPDAISIRKQTQQLLMKIYLLLVLLLALKEKIKGQAAPYFRPQTSSRVRCGR